MIFESAIWIVYLFVFYWFFFHLVIKEHKLQLKKNKLHFKPTVFCEWFPFDSCHLHGFLLWKKKSSMNNFKYLNSHIDIQMYIYSLWYLLNQYFMFVVVVVIIVGCFYFTASNCILYIIFRLATTLSLAAMLRSTTYVDKVSTF